MRADVADRPERTTLARLQPPVPVTFVEQPILEVVASDEADLAQPTRLDDLAEVLVQGIEPDVVVDGCHLAARRGLPDELGRLRGRHGKRLFADDMATGGEDRGRLGDVEMVRAGHVDDVHRRVRQELFEAFVRLRDPEGEGARRATLERAATPRTWTPIRRSASTWTGPMKPVPMIRPRRSELNLMPGASPPIPV